MPVILITGRSDQQPFAEAAGVSALLEKPIDIPILLETIRAALAEPMAQRRTRMMGRAGVAATGGKLPSAI